VSRDLRNRAGHRKGFFLNLRNFSAEAQTLPAQRLGAAR